MNTRTLLLMSCAVGVLGVAASPAFAQQTGGTPADANAAAANQANPPPNGGATGATGIPGASGVVQGSAISGDTAARSNTRNTTSSGATVGEVIVTAEKRSQSLQRVPAAVTAFTSEKRDLIGITNIQDMTNFTPGLQYSSQLDRVSLRGVGRLTNVQSAEGAVATYSDGIYTTSTVEAGKSPLFVDRTEVLRGPQGTLYGRNSIGGAINVISRRPTDDWYAEVRATGENYGHSILEGAVSGPTGIEGVDFRLAANWEKQRDGWFNNIIPGKPDEGNIIDTKLFEIQLKAKFNEHFEGWVKFDVANWTNGAGGPGARSAWYKAPYTTYEYANAATELSPGFGLNRGPFAPVGVVNANPLGSVNPQLSDPWTIASLSAYKVKLDDTFIFASEFVYHFDGADLKYTGGGTHYHYSLTSPPDPNSAPISQYSIPDIAVPGASTVVYPQSSSLYQEKLTWMSHELNFSSTYKGPFQYLVGAYYYGESYDQPVTAFDPNQPQLAAGAPVTGATCTNVGFNGFCPPSNGNWYDDRPHLEIRSRAVYGQIDWEFIPTFKTTLGIRYSNDHKYGYEDVRLLCYLQPTCYGTPPIGAQYTIGLPVIDLTQIPTVVSTGLPTPPTGVTGPTTYDPATGLSHRNYDISSDAVTGTAGIQWEPERGTLAYAKYSRGYKAAGFLIGITTVQNPNPATKQEDVNAYEVGFKKSLFNRKLTVDVSAFYYDYMNAQVPVSIAPTAGTLAPTNVALINVPKSVSQGVELETVWNPTRNLNIIFNYSYLDAHITQGQTVDPADPAALAPGATPVISNAACLAGTVFNATHTAVVSSSCGLDVFTGDANGLPTAAGGFQRAQNLNGNHLPNAPNHKIAFNINYTFHTRMGDIIPSASYTWRDVQYGSIFDRSFYASPASGQFDARITFRDIKDKYSIILFGKNLTNDIVYEGGATGFRQAGFLPNPANPYTGTPAPVLLGTYSIYPLSAPRTYGIELQYRFF